MNMLYAAFTDSGHVVLRNKQLSELLKKLAAVVPHMSVRYIGMVEEPRLRTVKPLPGDVGDLP
jgi:hypothetical protein